MIKFHELKVSDIVRETADSVTVELAVPEELKEEFRFTQGQYLTFRVQVNGEELRRNYSICSSPYEERLRVTSKKVRGGRVSGFLNEQLKVGDTLEVMPPMGEFYATLDPANEKEYVAFAGGSGITPVMSLIKTNLHVEPRSRFTLFYGNRDKDSIIFKEELDKLDEEYGDRLRIVHVLEEPEERLDPLFQGRLDKEKVATLLDTYVGGEPAKEYFICGPDGMKESVTTVLDERGVEKDRVHIELFTIPGADAVDEGETEQTVGGGAGQSGTQEGEDTGVSQVTVVIDDEEETFELDYEGDSILDAGLDEDLDLPFSCKGAVCATCKARLLEGQVEMDENHALPDEELDKGFILTCQSHPRTPKVKVDYDDI